MNDHGVELVGQSVVSEVCQEDSRRLSLILGIIYVSDQLYTVRHWDQIHGS